MPGQDPSPACRAFPLPFLSLCLTALLLPSIYSALGQEMMLHPKTTPRRRRMLMSLLVPTLHALGVLPGLASLR